MPVGRAVRRALDAGVAQGGDVLEGEQFVAAVEQGAAQLRALLADRVVEDRLERAVAAEQLRRGLRADALRARDPVGGIAAQGDEVGDLAGVDPVALADALGRSPLRRLCRRCGRRGRSPARRRTGTCRGRRSGAAPSRPPRPQPGVGAEQVVGLERLARPRPSSRRPRRTRGSRPTAAPAGRAPRRGRRGRRGTARSGRRRRRGRSRGRPRAGRATSTSRRIRLAAPEQRVDRVARPARRSFSAARRRRGTASTACRRRAAAASSRSLVPSDED